PKLLEFRRVLFRLMTRRVDMAVSPCRVYDSPHVSETLELDIRGAVAVITLNRPHVRNAIDEETRTALGAALNTVDHNKEVRGLILTGAGTAFCSGGDVKGMQQRRD